MSRPSFKVLWIVAVIVLCAGSLGLSPAVAADGGVAPEAVVLEVEAPGVGLGETSGQCEAQPVPVVGGPCWDQCWAEYQGCFSQCYPRQKGTPCHSACLDERVACIAAC